MNRRKRKQKQKPILLTRFRQRSVICNTVMGASHRDVPLGCYYTTAPVWEGSVGRNTSVKA